MRLLSVLALDRFGDFVGDAVVCPVRESVGQVMGVVLGGVSSNIVISVARVVRHVMDNREWHTSHAAMIIVKSVTQGDTQLWPQLQNWFKKHNLQFVPYHGGDKLGKPLYQFIFDFGELETWVGP